MLELHKGKKLSYLKEHKRILQGKYLKRDMSNEIKTIVKHFSSGVVSVLKRVLNLDSER